MLLLLSYLFTKNKILLIFLHKNTIKRNNLNIQIEICLYLNIAQGIREFEVSDKRLIHIMK